MLYLPHRRPAILSLELGKAVDETRRFRHLATHNYDGFVIFDIGPTIDAARKIAQNLRIEIAVFKDAIEPL